MGGRGRAEKRRAKLWGSVALIREAGTGTGKQLFSSDEAETLEICGLEHLKNIVVVGLAGRGSFFEKKRKRKKIMIIIFENQRKVSKNGPPEGCLRVCGTGFRAFGESFFWPAGQGVCSAPWSPNERGAGPSFWLVLWEEFYRPVGQSVCSGPWSPNFVSCESKFCVNPRAIPFKIAMDLCPNYPLFKFTIRLISQGSLADKLKSDHPPLIHEIVGLTNKKSDHPRYFTR